MTSRTERGREGRGRGGGGRRRREGEKRAKEERDEEGWREGEVEEENSLIKSCATCKYAVAPGKE